MNLEINAGTITLIITLVLNLFALVWGASKINSSVNNLTITTGKLETTMNGMIEKQNLHGAEIMVLKSDIKKSSDEIMLNRTRVHDIASDVIQPMLIMVNTLADKVREIKNPHA